MDGRDGAPCTYLDPLEELIMRWRAYLLFSFLTVGIVALMLDPWGYQYRRLDSVRPDAQLFTRVAAQRRNAKSTRVGVLLFRSVGGEPSWGT